jgi:NHL repeat-containing protein
MPSPTQRQRRPGLASLMTRAAWSLRIKLVITGLLLLGIGFAAGWVFRWVKEPVPHGSSSPSPAASASPLAKDSSAAVIYVATGYPASVREFPIGSNGNIAPSRVIAGPLTGLERPSSITVDHRGSVFVVNDVEILSFAPTSDGNASPTAIIAGPATTLGGFLSRPEGIAVDGRGFVLALTRDGIVGFPPDANGNIAPAIRMSSPKGESFWDYDFYWTRGIACDRYNIYVTNNRDSTKPNVAVYPTSSTGQTSPASVLVGATTGLQNPAALAVDGRGKLYVVNQDGPSITVYKQGSAGNRNPVVTIFGPATQLHSPRGIAIDSDGNIYIADSSGKAILEFAAGANGNVPPKAVISGNETGLDNPTAITIGPGS